MKEKTKEKICIYIILIEILFIILEIIFCDIFQYESNCNFIENILTCLTIIVSLLIAFYTVDKQKINERVSNNYSFIRFNKNNQYIGTSSIDLKDIKDKILYAEEEKENTEEEKENTELKYLRLLFNVFDYKNIPLLSADISSIKFEYGEGYKKYLKYKNKKKNFSTIIVNKDEVKNSYNIGIILSDKKEKIDEIIKCNTCRIIIEMSVKNSFDVCIYGIFTIILAVQDTIPEGWSMDDYKNFKVNNEYYEIKSVKYEKN